MFLLYGGDTMKCVGCIVTAALGLLALGFLARLAWRLICLGWGAL